MRNITTYKSQKEAFLFYLQKMDIEMIDLILDDKFSYFDVAKDIFINKLKSFKSELEALGEIDSILIYQNDTSSNTYYLIVENYELEQELTFKEVENKIVDINSHFNSQLKKSCPLALHFGLDERINFKPTVDYLLQVQQCTNAFKELVNDDDKILDYYIIESWMNKHKSLYHQVKDNLFMFKFNDFRNLFDLLVDLNELIGCSFAAQIAVNEFDDSNEASIRKWKNDHISLFVRHTEYFEGYFMDFEKITYSGRNDIIQLDLFPNIYLLRNDFIYIKKFNDLFFTLTNFSSLENNNDDVIPF
jgi:hypothetical protein